MGLKADGLGGRRSRDSGEIHPKSTPATVSRHPGFFVGVGVDPGRGRRAADPALRVPEANASVFGLQSPSAREI